MSDTEFNIPQIPKPTHPRFRDLEGMVIERLTVIAFAGIPKRETMWYAKCTCGNLVIMGRSNLLRKQTKSCGCYRLDHPAHQTQNGHSSHPLWKTWKAMLHRCENETDPSYENYGKRGITVCDRWHDFALFAQDMGERPDQMTLERKNNDLGYSPENCEWADRSTQLNNTRRTRHLTYNGVTQSLEQWAVQLGMSSDTLWGRIVKLKWNVDKALTSPINRKFRPLK